MAASFAQSLLAHGVFFFEKIIEEAIHGHMSICFEVAKNEHYNFRKGHFTFASEKGRLEPRRLHNKRLR